MQDQATLSRRNFIKFSGLALANLFSLPFTRQSARKRTKLENDISDALAFSLKAGVLEATGFQEWLPHIQGRVIDPNIEVFESPDENSNIIKQLWKDMVEPISKVTYNNDTNSHNKVWYQLKDGYAHSGSIQPVNTILNDPVEEIRPGGQLAEVTVPYTDTHWAIGRDQPIAYRMYYQTTHWVVQTQIDNNGDYWYTLIEDKWDLRYFARASHFRLIPDKELIQLSPDVPNPLKRLVVYLDKQILIAYENQTPVFMTRVSTGGKFRDGNFSTQPGNYLTYHKRPSRHMAAGNLAAGGYDLPGVPWISYFTESGVSFHGTYWHNNYGRTRSHGCINLSPQAAKWVYRWTSPIVPSDAQMVYKNYGTSLRIYEE
jgi:lipoprotein-anchoring transpeptidase ErfK/SrfK